MFYNLLDRRLYSDNPTALPMIKNDKNFTSSRRMAVYGILNFGISNSGNILLPNLCMALQLFWQGMRPGHIVPEGDVNIRNGQPLDFELKGGRRIPKYIIPKNELAKHGLQLVTLYL